MNIWAGALIGAGVCLAAGLLTPPMPGLLKRPARRRAAALCLGTALLLAAAYGGLTALTDSLSVLQIALFGAAGAVTAAAAALDLRTRRVLDLHWLLIATLGLVTAWVMGGILPALLSAFSAAATLSLAGAIASRLTRRPALGAGDILLATSLALWVAPAHSPFAFLIAVAVTAFVFMTNRSGKIHALPFAPGLAVGFGLIALTGKGFT